MKSKLFLAIFTWFLWLHLGAQNFSYVWPATGQKVDLKVTYAPKAGVDSGFVFIDRNGTDSLSFTEIDPLRSLIFIGNSITSDTNELIVPLFLRRFIIIPFDPGVNGISFLNGKHPELDYVKFLSGNSEFVGFRGASSNTGEYFFCSCGMNFEDPGDCKAGIEYFEDYSITYCVVDGNCDFCIGYTYELSNIINSGGGIIVEVKDMYAYDLNVD